MILNSWIDPGINAREQSKLEVVDQFTHQSNWQLFREDGCFYWQVQVDPLASDPDIVEPGTGQPNLEPGLRKEHDRRRRVDTVESVELIVQ